MNYMNDSSSGKLSHVPSQPASVPSLGGMLSRDPRLRPETWNLSDTSGNVFYSPRAEIDFVIDTLSRNASLLESKCYRRKPNSRKYRTPVAGGEERSRESIPTPRFAWRPSTMNSFFPAEGAYPQNCMAHQSRLQNSEIQFDKFTTLATFACWKIRFKTEVCTYSQFPTEAMLWIKEVVMAESLHDLKSS